MNERPVKFVRDATGLVRDFGLPSVVAINLLAASPFGGYAVAPVTLGTLFPGANIILVFVIAAILTAFNGLVYSLLAVAMPRAGGDYVYNSRIIHPAIGFMSNWGFTWSQFVVIAFTAAAEVTFGISNALAVLGYVMDDNGLIGMSTLMGIPLNIFIVGTIFVLVTGCLALLPTRMLGKILSVGLALTIVSSVSIFLVLFTSSHDQFVEVLNQFLLKTANVHDGYDAVISAAQNLGYAPGPWLQQSILALPVAYFFYVGFTYSSYVGGEVKSASVNQIKGIFIALVFSFAFYALALGQYLNIIGTQFNESVAFLSANHPDKYPLPVSPSGNFFIGLLASHNLVLNLIVQGGWSLWNFLILPIVIMVCVRNLFAWSFDRVIPEKFASLSGSGSPWLATLLTILVGEILLALYVLTSIFTLLVNYVVIFSIAFLLTGVAAIVFPYRRRKLFESSPAIVRKKIVGIPLITIAGVVNVLLFAVILYSSFLLPAFSGPVGTAAIAFVIGIYATGFAGYYIARGIRRRGGIDLSLIYETLPPE